MAWPPFAWLVAVGCTASTGEPAASHDAGRTDPDAAAGTGAADAASRLTVSVAAADDWSGTPLTLARGDVVAIRSSGAITFGVDLQSGPAGYPPDDYDGVNAVGCADHAGLVARVGDDGAVIAVGQGAWLVAPREGELALGPNDRNLEDNSGAFTVELDTGHGLQVRDERSVTVPASAGWIDTGIDLGDDDLLAIHAEGTVDNNLTDDVEYDADGIAGSAGDAFNVLACANHFALLGAVGAGAPFLVGRDLSREARGEGRLWLSVNHTSPAGNTGKLSAAVLVGRPL